MIEMTIESIRLSPGNSQRVIILKEKTGERHLPIWIGSAEADSIAAKLDGTEMRRPLTHDLLNSLISTLGGSVDSVVINELKNDTFYARINLVVEGNRVEVDCRPSDALALAVRAGTPILINEAILNQGGVLLDQASGKPIPAAGNLNQSTEGLESTKPLAKEDLKRMSAYTDFINNINLDDLGKGKA